jgi:hypothetical protein
VIRADLRAETSVVGTSRHFAALRNLCRYRGIADIVRMAGYAFRPRWRRYGQKVNAAVLTAGLRSPDAAQRVSGALLIRGPQIRVR